MMKLWEPVINLASAFALYCVLKYFPPANATDEDIQSSTQSLQLQIKW